MNSIEKKEISEGLFVSKFKKNIIFYKKCEKVEYVDYMEIIGTRNNFSVNNLGYLSVNLRELLLEVKMKGYYGLIIFEKDEKGKSVLSERSIKILEGYISKSIAFKQNTAYGNVYIIN